MNFSTYWQRSNRKVLVAVIIGCAIVLQSAHTNYTILDQKARQQGAALAELKRWRIEYEALLPVQSQWNTALPSVSTITDKHELYKALRLDSYGLSTSEEKLVVKDAKPLLVNGSPLAATRVCVTTGGDAGLALTAPRFSDLLTGLDALAKRRDVEVANITLAVANNQPKALVDACLVFRNS